MQPPSLGLWILFLWIKGTVNGTEVKGIIGGEVALSCRYPDEELPKEFRVTWQIEGENTCLVDAYLPPPEDKTQCPDFINRTQLSDHLMQGNFTLHMFNISHNDEHNYTCHIQERRGGMFVRIKNTSATLKVAANYSKPILTGPVKAGEEVVFTCNSSQGYPKPNVYWINLTDNSLLNGISIPPTQEPSGTFSVFSTLIIKGASSDVKVRCVIENELLQVNLTADPDSVVAGNLLNSSLSAEPETQASVSHALVGSIVAVLLAVFLGICWWYKRRSSLHQNYATPAEMVDFQRQWTAEETAGGAEAAP